MVNIWENTNGQSLSVTHIHAPVSPLMLGPVTGWKARVMDGQGLITFNQLCPWIMMNGAFYTHKTQKEKDALRKDVCHILFVEFISSGRCRSSPAFFPYIHLVNAAHSLLTKLPATVFFCLAHTSSSVYIHLQPISLLWCCVVMWQRWQREIPQLLALAIRKLLLSTFQSFYCHYLFYNHWFYNIYWYHLWIPKLYRRLHVH